MKLDKEKVVREFLPYIKRLANDLKSNLPKNVEVDDLVQEGLLALLQAIERYDPRFGASLKTYAYTRIKGAMLDYLRKIDWLPKNVRHDIKKLEEFIMTFMEKHDRLPTFKEMAEELGTDEETVIGIYSEFSKKQLLEIDKYIFDEENSFDIVVDESQNVKEKVHRDLLMEILSEAISTLNEKEQQILSLRHEHELSLKEIAEIYGVSESRISQILSVIYVKLKKKLSR